VGSAASRRLPGGVTSGSALTGSGTMGVDVADVRMTASSARRLSDPPRTGAAGRQRRTALVRGGGRKAVGRSAAARGLIVETIGVLPAIGGSSGSADDAGIPIVPTSAPRRAHERKELIPARAPREDRRGSAFLREATPSTSTQGLRPLRRSAQSSSFVGSAPRCRHIEVFLRAIPLPPCDPRQP
jgi:hypothetical protein